MTKEQLKEQCSMKSVIEQYGFRINRSGFVHCPFHKGDRTPSMKVYKDSYYCFGCGANGDIFTFTEQMNSCSFKEAFYALGGTYEKPTFRSKLAVYRQQKRQIMREKETARTSEKRELNNLLIEVYRKWMRKSEPMSDAWSACCRALEKQLYIHDVLNGGE